MKPLDERRDRVGEIKRMYTVPRRAGAGVSRPLLAALEARRPSSATATSSSRPALAQPEAMAPVRRATAGDRITPYGHYKHSPQSVCFAKAIDPPA